MMAEEIQRLSDWGQALKLAADRGCHSAAALRRQLELDRIGHRRLQLVGFAIGVCSLRPDRPTLCLCREASPIAG
jgi:hypothetical protein